MKSDEIKKKKLTSSENVERLLTCNRELVWPGSPIIF